MDFYSGTLQSWFGKGENWFRAFAQFLSGSLLCSLLTFSLPGSMVLLLAFSSMIFLDAVHLKHYPDQPWQKAPSISRSILFSLRILLLTLVWNFVCSPILILGWFIPPVGLTVQILLNGYLLGKEYGQLVEYRIPQNQSVSSHPQIFHQWNDCCNYMDRARGQSLGTYSTCRIDTTHKGSFRAKLSTAILL